MASIRKRTKKDGSASYRVEVRLKGFPPQRATFHRLTDAKKWVQNTESAIREGRYFKTAEARKHTLADVVDRYIREVLPKKPKAGDRKTQLQWFKAEIGPYTLADVTPSKITECRKKLETEPDKKGKLRSPATVNRYLAALSHAFTVAVREWEWLEDSPMRKVAKAPEPRGRVRFLSDDETAPDGSVIQGERTRLLRACKGSDHPYLYAVVVLALSTGMRQGEIMNLRRSDVDVEAGRITLHDTKNGERRTVPLVGTAQEVLREHTKVRRLDTDLVFPSHRKPTVPADLRQPWLAALREAELSDFRFHDLRHTAASYLAMNGASLAEIAEVLGHKTFAMVKRYSHLSETHTAGVVARMNKRIFGELA